MPTIADQLCHIANAGFFIETDGKGILIDAVIDEGLDGFDQPSKPLLAQIEGGKKPFDTVKLVLITHYHADHFDPVATLRHLRNNAAATYIMPPQAFAAIEKLGIAEEERGRIKTPLPGFDDPAISMEVDDIGLSIYRISHGANRPIEDLGFFIQLKNSTSLFHPGDMSTTTAQLQAVGISGLPVDYLLLPFWAGGDADSKALVDTAWTAKHIIPMHFQSEAKPWMEQLGGPIGVRRSALARWDNTLELIGEMRCHSMGK